MLLRLGAAVTIGALIGLDRNLHGKPSGVRTLGLVSLGAALLTIAGVGVSVIVSIGVGAGAPPASADALSRVVQGIVTGIGFLGAGVIVHQPGSDKVRGLTTAASIWITAILGIVCGLGAWRLAGMTLAMVFLLLVVGKRIERCLHRRWLDKPQLERDNMAVHDE